MLRKIQMERNVARLKEFEMQRFREEEEQRLKELARKEFIAVEKERREETTDQVSHLGSINEARKRLEKVGFNKI